MLGNVSLTDIIKLKGSELLSEMFGSAIESSSNIHFADRLCGLVVRVPGSILGATRFSEK
jgi:hypothetical protein